MSLLYPAWLAALIIIPFLILAVIMIRRNKAKVWSAFVSSHHKSELVQQSKSRRFWFAFSCSLLGLICLIMAMTRPYSGKSVSREKIESRNILIAMDTSLSMLCEDVQPNRLSSGVTFAVNLISALPDDHFGIMAYAGSPNVITSLSIDHPSIIEELGHLNPSSAHIAGSNLQDALYEGINTLKRAGKQANALIIITDGTETLDEINKITSLARESYVQIFTVGVGTLRGDTIPVNGEPHRDIQGKVVITKLEDKVLRQLARETSGVYTHISTQPEKAIAYAIQSMTQYEQQGREVEIPKELYQWFLAPGVFLLLLSAFLTSRLRFKSATTALILISFFTSLSDSQADEVSSTKWTEEISNKYVKRPAQIQAGYNALEKKDYKSAITYFNQAREGTKATDEETHSKLSLAIAQAAYRLRDYPLATKEYSKALGTGKPEIQNISQYNLANTLYKQHTANINVPADQELVSYLEDQIRIAALNDSKLDEMAQGLSNAVIHYSDLLEENSNINSAKSNKLATEQVIEAIKQARITVAEEKKKQQEQEKKDKEKQKDPKEKDGEGEGEKPDDQSQGEDQGEKEGDEGEEGDPNTKGKGDGDGKEKEGDKNPDDQNQSENENQNPDSNTENQSNSEDDSEAKKPDDQTQPSNTDKPAKFDNKKDALEFLRKHADTRKKPLTNRRGYYNRPAIDW